ncbi:hypothetical protein RFN29_34950, partial [Mesorhizobium sp. VK22B]
FRRWRSIDETVRDIPVRMRQTRMQTRERESQAGLLCQARTTSELFKLVAQHLNAAEFDDVAFRQRHDLGGYAVYVHADKTYGPLHHWHEQRSQREHDKDGSALAALPGES